MQFNFLGPFDICVVNSYIAQEIAKCVFLVEPTHPMLTKTSVSCLGENKCHPQGASEASPKPPDLRNGYTHVTRVCSSPSPCERNVPC